MLKRRYFKKLNEWKASPKHKSLIIIGARQVGKTFLVDAFAAENYSSYIRLNFLEQPDLKNIFSGNLDTASLLLNISAYGMLGVPVPGKTLILLDEIQECPNAAASLKFWTQDDRYDVIATGSALGMNYTTSASWPVGYVEYMDMFALDFEEFLWAVGVSEDVIKELKTLFNERHPVPEFLHQKMLDYLRWYMVLGGMPEVITAFLENHDFAAADAVQKRIYRDYLTDIARLAPPQVKIRAEKCYRSVPLQLSGDNHKFQYSLVESKGTSSRFETSIDWIRNAYMVKEVYNLKAIAYPAELYKDESNFRLYPTDIGMLMAPFDLGTKKALLEEKTLEAPPSSIMLGTAKGGLFEALAADMLMKGNHKDLYFYKNPKNTMEIEFFIMTSSGLIPIEIKAGRKKANSLNSVLESGLVPYGYKMSSQNIGVAGKRITLPLYMLMFL